LIEKADFVKAARTEEEKNNRYNLRYDLFTDTIKAIQQNRKVIDTIRRTSVKVKEDELYYSSKMDSYIIWTDGSYRKEIRNPDTPQEEIIEYAGSGIYSKEESKINIGMRTPGLQNNYHAELFAIWLALRMVRKSANITIVLDCEGAIRSIENTKVHRDKFVRKSMFSPITMQIREMIKERSGKTKLSHCYSHLEELGAKAAQSDASEKVKKEYLRKMEKMIGLYGNETQEIILGNDRADSLAKLGTNQRVNNTVINLPESRIGVATEKGEVITAGFRRLVKRNLQKKRVAELGGEGKLIKGVTKAQTELLSDRNPKLSGLKTFQYKLIHNKLTTPVKLKQRKVSWAPTNTKCTFDGCNQEEDLKHILSCPQNPKFADDKAIIDILNRIDPTYGWANRKMWYSHPPRLNKLPHTAEREKLYREGKSLGDKGFIPSDIMRLIEKKCEKTANATISELQQAILTRAKTIWAFRCKIFYEKRAIERIMRREEEEQRRQEEEERRQREERQREEERRQREEERRRALNNPANKRNRMRYLRLRQKARIQQRPANAGSAQAPRTPSPLPVQASGTSRRRRSTRSNQDHKRTRTEGTKRRARSKPETAKKKRRRNSQEEDYEDDNIENLDDEEGERDVIVIEDDEEERAEVT